MFNGESAERHKHANGQTAVTKDIVLPDTIQFKTMLAGMWLKRKSSG